MATFAKYYESGQMPAWPKETHGDCHAPSPHRPRRLSYVCTRDKGHTGTHMAQVLDNRVVAEWL